MYPFSARPTLILGLIWQLIRIELLSCISIKDIPELVVLLEDGEDVSALQALTPEQILLRWVNYHVHKSKRSERTATNFGDDFRVSNRFCEFVYLCM